MFGQFPVHYKETRQLTEGIEHCHFRLGIDYRHLTERSARAFANEIQGWTDFSKGLLNKICVVGIDAVGERFDPLLEFG